MQCQIELATSPQRDRRGRRGRAPRPASRVVRAGAQLGVRLAGAGTHPFSLAEAQPLTVRDRYRELAAALRYPLRREACFGMHVHVAVGQPRQGAARDRGDARRSARSCSPSRRRAPFWRGEPTGLHSTRTVVFQSLPRSGLPPAFGCYEDYARGVERLVRAGALADHSYLWWDVRPHPRFGTIEVRILDAQPRAADSAALAGVVQALVRHYGRRYDRRRALPGRRPLPRRREPLARRASRAARTDGRSRAPVRACPLAGWSRQCSTAWPTMRPRSMRAMHSTASRPSWQRAPAPSGS